MGGISYRSDVFKRTTDWHFWSCYRGVLCWQQCITLNPIGFSWSTSTIIRC